MDIKQTFRSFTAATHVLRSTSECAKDARIENYEATTISPELEINWVLGALPALPALPAFLAFSVELGLKTMLIGSNTNQVPWGHNLEGLFDQLPSNIQNRIRADVIEKIPELTEEAFKKKLTDHGKSFQEWRYFHEKETLSFDTEFLGNILFSIHNYTVEECY